jgi:hypothetical protein
MPVRDEFQPLEVSQIDERQFAEQPWLAKQWAGRAEAPGVLEERAEILLRLARLPIKKQVLAISACAGRDKLVEHLLAREEFGAVHNLLHSDLARWQPDVSEFGDLKWLLTELLQVKKQAVGKKARVVLHTSSGSRAWESTAMLEALMEETLSAAAAAWVRCLCGPGGGHRVFEIPQALADRELAEAVISELARDPRALTLFMEDVRLQPADVGLSLEEYLAFLQSGAEAARYCQDTIITGISSIGVK